MVGSYLADGGPHHVVFGEVVPRHFVDACLEDALEVGIDGVGDDASHTHLVHVEDRGVPIIED
jgi:hypothetical protein